MKLVRKPESTNWFVEIIAENGSVHQLDTGCTNRAEAQELVELAKVSRLEKAGRAHRLTSEVVTLITVNQKITVANALAEWDKWFTDTHQAERTRSNCVMAIQQWITETNLEGKSIGSIGEKDISEWVNDANSPIKLGTRTLRLSMLRSFFKFCLNRRYRLDNPAQLVRVNRRLLSHTQKEVKHKPIFTDEEIEFLIVKASANEEPPALTPGFFKSAIILGRDLGLRLVDICNLETKAFDFSKNLVTVHCSKTGARIELPLTKRVKDHLVTLRYDGKYLFPTERDILLDPDRRATISVYFSRFLKRHKLPGSFHSLRASYATTLANEGMSLEQIAECMGHAATRTTKSYVRKPNAARVNLR